MADNKPAIMSRYRMFNRNYSREEFLGEVKNLVSEEGFEDFLIVATGRAGTATRIGSDDKDLRYGDIIWMLKKAEMQFLDDEKGD